MQVSTSTALETLRGIARQGEFWECSGVEQKHLDVIEANRGDAPLDETVDAFVTLFEAVKKRKAAPTSHTNRLFENLAPTRRPGERMSDVVVAFQTLYSFHRDTHLLDDRIEKAAVESLGTISECMQEGDDRQIALKLYMQGPETFPQRLAEYREKNRASIERMAAPQAAGLIDEKLDWILVGDCEVATRTE